MMLIDINYFIILIGILSIVSIVISFSIQNSTSCSTVNASAALQSTRITGVALLVAVITHIFYMYNCKCNFNLINIWVMAFGIFVIGILFLISGIEIRNQSEQNNCKSGEEAGNRSIYVGVTMIIIPFLLFMFSKFKDFTKNPKKIEKIKKQFELKKI